MNTTLKISLATLATSALIYSCKPKISQDTYTKGTADFTTYVAVGNSLTSGYSDGALRKEGQTESYPNMLATQFALVGGGAFKIPYLADGAGNDGSGTPRRILYNILDTANNTNSLGVTLDHSKTPSDLSTSVASGGPYNLVGVPGIRAVDANFALYSIANPFLTRFCATPGTSTLISEAMRLNPTFFTLWLGANDVLGYATSGGVYSVDPTDPYGPLASGQTPLISPTMVKASIQQTVDSLTKNGAKGAIANIPDVTSIPYFTTVPWNAIPLTDTNIVKALNASYAALGITWALGQNHLVIADGAAPGGMRAATSEDLILLTLPQDSIKKAGWGTLKPIPDQYVLDKAEVAIVKAHIAQYNADISSIAAAKGLALVDMNSYMASLKTGIVFNGITFSPSFISGGAFSLDGVHPNNRGYALLANEFIRRINATYGSTLPFVDATKYSGIVFPQ